MRKTLGFTLTTDALLCGRRQRHRTPRADPVINYDDVGRRHRESRQ